MKSIDKEWVEKNINSNGEVIIPEGIQIIEKGAFQGNDKIKKITMPDSLIGISPRAFAECMKNIEKEKELEEKRKLEENKSQEEMEGRR